MCQSLKVKARLIFFKIYCPNKTFDIDLLSFYLYTLIQRLITEQKYSSLDSLIRTNDMGLGSYYYIQFEYLHLVCRINWLLLY